MSSEASNVGSDIEPPEDDGSATGKNGTERMLHSVPEGISKGTLGNTVEVAASLFNVSMAMLAVTGADDSWVRATVGFEGQDHRHAAPFCTHAARNDGPLVVENVPTDDRFANNPLVSGAPEIRFFAGVPLEGPAGEVCGALGVLDTEPRTSSPVQVKQLQNLSEMVTQEMSLQRDVRTRDEIERRYEFIFNATHQFTGLMEPDGTLLEANDTALDFGNLNRADVLGKPFWETSWWQTDECTQKELRNAIQRAAEGEFVRYEVEVQGAEETIPIDFSIRPITNGKGEVIFLVPEGRDISQRKEYEQQLREAKAETEQALRKRETQLRALANTIPGVVYQFYVHDDGSYGCHCVTERAETMLGISADADQFYERFLERVPASHRDELLASVAEAVEQQQPWRFEMPFETPSGERIWLLGSSTPEPREEELLFNGVLLDITERKLAEQALEDEQQVLRRMYRVTSDLSVPFEEKIHRLMDLGREYLDLPNGFLTRVSGGRQRIALNVGDHPLLQAGSTCSLSSTYCRKTIEGEEPLAVQNAPEEGWTTDPAYEKFELGSYIGSKVIVDGELYGTFCFADTSVREGPFTERERVFVDLLTRWASYELEQRQSARQLERQHARLDRFASVLSHDLRNPLNVALGRLTLAQEEYETDEEDHLGAVRRALTRMEDIIQDVLLLNWGRQEIDVDEMEVQGLADRAEECWTGLETAQATLQIDSDATLRADPGRLRRLLGNLFRNAVEHAGEEAVVRLGALPEGFFVEDDGPGIPPDKQDDVFEEGYSSNEEGTGLGLSIVRTIAEAHGWTLSVTEGRDGGARFEVHGVDRTDP